MKIKFLRSISHVLVVISLFAIYSCQSPLTDQKEQITELEKETKDSIIAQHLERGAWRYPLYSQEWQDEIDKGLAKDSTIAYLWQQKAMPLFKQGKYELAMPFLDQAVRFGEDRWLSYRAFMKCIFSKTYREAIIDFEKCKSLEGNSYVMDHTYNFYIALCHLQLNNFTEAEQILANEVNVQSEKGDDQWVHHLDLFYLGIAHYELKNYDNAIAAFDRAIEKYEQFSDAIYYKGICVGRKGDREKGAELIEKAKAFAARGYTINEDNVIYERYPYQVRFL